MKRAATEEKNESGNEIEKEWMRGQGSQEECDDQGGGGWLGFNREGDEPKAERAKSHQDWKGPVEFSSVGGTCDFGKSNSEMGGGDRTHISNER